MSGNDDKRVAFVFNGNNLAERPENLTHLIVDSSAKEIPAEAFEHCCKLQEVEFQDGVQVIGDYAFHGCEKLKRVTYPKTLRVIGVLAFYNTSLANVDLPNGLQKIGEDAFAQCKKLKTAAFPSTVTNFGEGMFQMCTKLKSVKLSENLDTIKNTMFFACDSLTSLRVPAKVKIFESRESDFGTFCSCSSLLSVEIPKGMKCLQVSGQNPTFKGCFSLVNIALPPTINEVKDNTFIECDELLDVFPEHDDLVHALKHRFDECPIHEICYYHSYEATAEAMDKLEQITKYNALAVSRVDAFGMTPLHILALSAQQNLELFQKLLETSPNHLLDVKDKWGNTTLHYLCFNASSDSKQLITLIVNRTIAKRVNHLGLEQWRAPIQNEIDVLLSINDAEVGLSDRKSQLGEMLSTLKIYERLEATSLLELALWKQRLCESFVSTKSMGDKNGQGGEERGQKRAKFDVDRKNCRMICGAEIVIPLILSFLGNVDFELGDEEEE